MIQNTLSNHEPSLRIKSLTSAHSINNCPMKNIKCYAHLLEIWVLTCDYFLDRHGSSWGRREWKQMTIWNKQIVLYQLLLPLWQTCKQCWTMCRMESTISNKQILHFRNLGGLFYKCFAHIHIAEIDYDPLVTRSVLYFPFWTSLTCLAVSIT